MDAQNLHHKAELASWYPYLTCHQIWMFSMLGAGPVKFKLLICFIMFVTFVAVVVLTQSDRLSIFVMSERFLQDFDTKCSKLLTCHVQFTPTSSTSIFYI